MSAISASSGLKALKKRGIAVIYGIKAVVDRLRGTEPPNSIASDPTPPPPSLPPPFDQEWFLHTLIFYLSPKDMATFPLISTAFPHLDLVEITAPWVVRDTRYNVARSEAASWECDNSGRYLSTLVALVYTLKPISSLRNSNSLIQNFTRLATLVAADSGLELQLASSRMSSSRLLPAERLRLNRER